MFLAPAPVGLVGARFVVAHLAILAVALTLLRSRMHESPRWLEAQAAEANGGEGGPARGRWRDLFTRQHIGSLDFLSGMYLFWNPWAGRSEERRVGQSCVRPCSVRWLPLP